MLSSIKIGISSCLMGNPVRYDGGHRHDRFLTQTLGLFCEYVPVCPEVECGMSTPRNSLRLEGDPDNPRLITRKTREDHTRQMQTWFDKKLPDTYEGLRLKAARTYLNPHPFELKLRNYF
jgi:uncharacterized protein YbbK (DUF523 family)